MNTTEHTELGDALRFENWNELNQNPYIHFNEKGVMFIKLQGLDEQNLPQSTQLDVSAGTIIAMAGDYFGGKELNLTLPTQSAFTKQQKEYNPIKACVEMGNFFIQDPINQTEMGIFTTSYLKLANSAIRQKDIEVICQINNANYVKNATLNSYLQEIMFAIKVKNYKDILNRNLSHFTPWSVRVYVTGHTLALHYAQLAYELNQLQANANYQSNNPTFNELIAAITGNSTNDLKDLSYRFQALALGVEMFCFHYYTDHYAAGHEAMVGDLRSVLPEKYGYIGGLLVNNLHDELNNLSVYTKKLYNASIPNTPPIKTTGDNDFNDASNRLNKEACIGGMEASLKDLQAVFQGKEIPLQQNYGGLDNLPDIDVDYWQPQPLFILGKDDKVYYRKNLSKIFVLSSTELQNAYNDPLNHGYVNISNKFSAFILFLKLRLFSYFYMGKVQPHMATPFNTMDLKETSFSGIAALRPIETPNLMVPVSPPPTPVNGLDPISISLTEIQSPAASPVNKELIEIFGPFVAAEFPSAPSTR